MARAFTVGLLLASAFVRSAAAQDDVLEAVRKQDAAALQALAKRDRPDPWQVADDLCARGEKDAALAFAKAAPRPDTAALHAYVEAHRPNKETRDRLAAAAKTQDPAARLKALGAMPAAPGDVVGVRLLVAHGHALRAARRLVDSVKAFREAAAAAEKMGWLAQASQALHEGARSAYLRRDPLTALACYERRVEVERKRERKEGVASCLMYTGRFSYQAGNLREAARRYALAVEAAEETGNFRLQATALHGLASVRTGLGNPRAALDALAKARLLFEKVKDRRGTLTVAVEQAGVLERVGKRVEALKLAETVAAAAGEMGDPMIEANAWMVVGATQAALGDYPRSLEVMHRALELHTRAKSHLAIVATVQGNLGASYSALAEYAEAEEYLRAALQTARRLGDRVGEARTLYNLGFLATRQGAAQRALARLHEARDLAKGIGAGPLEAKALNQLAIVYSHLIRDGDRALAAYEAALKLYEKQGAKGQIARVLGDMAVAYLRLDRPDEALASAQRSRERAGDSGERNAEAIALTVLAAIQRETGKDDEAAKSLQAAYEIFGGTGDRKAKAFTRISLGHLHLARDDPKQARPLAREALDAALEFRSPDAEVQARALLGQIYLKEGDASAAVQELERAVALLPELVGGLSGEESAFARESWGKVYGSGLVAAAQGKDVARFAWFLESARAGALLESLGGRAALRESAVPDALRKVERDALRAEVSARAGYRAALRSKERPEIQKARGALDAASARVQEVQDRIQREAHAIADVVYPEPAGLAEIRTELADEETLVLYALAVEESAYALVATRKDARLVELGRSDELKTACRSLRAGDPKADPDAAIARLAKKLVAPLGLDKRCRRVLVSPSGVLAYVPFALLDRGREVAYVPSGTTYRELKKDRARGKRVLALGDPERGGGDATGTRGAAPRGRLPGSAAEARAIGDVTLVGKEATRAALMGALDGEPRWRAVHFACHALVDPEHPMLSALVLAPQGDDDGFLRMRDLYRMRVSADLAVLSACETGKGRVFKAEGVVGFTRGFMFAGAPRVLVSLWKVDDAATRALMVKFYELWKEGKKDTAAALREAQAHVALQEQWKHPYYWAAWQLWGLPD